MSLQDSQESNISLAALVVALAALIVATGQLLGQYFATADGYRRCQPSVMGAWAKFTHLKWKWTQFRFETIFTVPEIVMLPLVTLDYPQQLVQPSAEQDLKWVASPEVPTAACKIDGGSVLQIEAIDPRYVGQMQDKPEKYSIHKNNPELACWLPFLQCLHTSELQMYDLGCFSNLADGAGLRRSACRSVQCSWDFMSPDLVYPLAITNVGDIAILIARLGLNWLIFQPEDGIMRAEGRGIVIFSTLVRSIGPILHFPSGRRPSTPVALASDPLSIKEVYIPTIQADMMRFGLLPTDDSLLHGIGPLAMGTIDEVRATLDIFDPTGCSSKKVRDNRQFESTSTFGLSELISTIAPVLRRKATAINRLPVPTEHPTGLTYAREGFVIFRGRLEEYIKIPRI